MPYVAAILITLLLAVPAFQQYPPSCSAIEARPRMAALWNTSLTLVNRILPTIITKEKAAEIAADFMTTFYHVQVGALETQEFRITPVPFWLICFSDAIKGSMRQNIRSAAGWDGGCAESGEAVLNSITEATTMTIERPLQHSNTPMLTLATSYLSCRSGDTS
jgi:hypothetical protein